ncbi:MAG TPA: DUF2059 domain-containing protein [Ottowia sp.]|nr:DUF2059 domain-containing protein [Ottowia sp.]HMT57984.1 DUF2059 domain-containing protein [Ottowia sp.]HMT64207.1 DUF2059 domain-containing protein [Ottowia sp.]HOK12916.1 DUF2059 domain-containing protein [Ottowia sp.]HQZ56418.1 DUF2059 domain-containing protein [Ottowia sp.]
MNMLLPRIPAAIILVAVCALSTGAMAQNDAKKALATKLAQLQLKTDGATMADQLTGSAVQPIVAGWSQRLDETVPPARQKDVRDKLDVELKKFADNTHKAVEAQVGKSAEAALVPIFMEKLSEDEMKTIIAYMESPASAKLQALGADATDAWAKRIIEATRSQVEAGAKTFESAANRIVGAAGGSGSGGNSPAKK